MSGVVTGGVGEMVGGVVNRAPGAPLGRGVHAGAARRARRTRVARAPVRLAAASGAVRPRERE